MSIEQYTLSSDKLIICDRELDIDIALEFLLPRLPSNLEGAGIVQDRDADGNLLSAYLVSDGRRHGQCQLFAEEGRLRAEMFYLHGKLHGPSLMYSDGGTVLSKTWYCDGKKIGKSHFYSVSGALLSLQRFKNGQWEGLQEYFYETGATILETAVGDGKLTQSFKPESLGCEDPFTHRECASPRPSDSDSKSCITLPSRTAASRIKSLIPFSSGKLHGEVKLFWESGKPKRSVHYSEGLRKGFDRLWNEQGILIDEGEYDSGKPIGVHRHYFANGKVKEELNYHTPMRFDSKQWNENGKMIVEGTFAPDLTYTERVFLEPHGSKVRKGVWDENRIRWK